MRDGDVTLRVRRGRTARLPRRHDLRLRRLGPARARVRRRARPRVPLGFARPAGRGRRHARDGRRDGRAGRGRRHPAAVGHRRSALAAGVARRPRRDRAVGDRARRRGRMARLRLAGHRSAARATRTARRSARPSPARGSGTAASSSSPARRGCAPVRTTPRPAASSRPTRCRRCPGTAYAANTYHYAGNDPLGRVDPLGLRPVSEQELREIRDRMGQNFFARNADYIIAGALIVGGIAVMATGVGGPLGAAMIGGALLSAGASAGIQKVTTGSVNYTEVAIAGLVGGAAGGLGFGAGALVQGTSRAAAVGRGALAGGVESFAGGAANRGIHGRNPFDPTGHGDRSAARRWHRRRGRVARRPHDAVTRRRGGAPDLAGQRGPPGARPDRAEPADHRRARNPRGHRHPRRRRRSATSHPRSGRPCTTASSRPSCRASTPKSP